VTEVRRHVAAAPEAVFATMSDAWLMPAWVVGNTHIRGVEAEWPAPGSRMHHRIGPWPFSVSDSTTIIECEPPHRLVLQARAYPLGQLRIELAVEPNGDGSLVRMAEVATHGVWRIFDFALFRRLLAARNRECLARLAAIVQNRIAIAASGRSGPSAGRVRADAARRSGQPG
jgi:uncharacterized protein YndB with AHSA1/START domain